MQRFLFKYFSNTSPMSSNSCRQIAENWVKEKERSSGWKEQHNENTTRKLWQDETLLVKYDMLCKTNTERTVNINSSKNKTTRPGKYQPCVWEVLQRRSSKHYGSEDRTSRCLLHTHPHIHVQHKRQHAPSSYVWLIRCQGTLSVNKTFACQTF